MTPLPMISPSRVQALLAAQGYETEINYSGDYVTITCNHTAPFQIFFTVKDLAHSDTYFNHFRISWTHPIGEIDPMQFINASNHFNIQSRYSKAYVCPIGDRLHAVIEMDYLCPDGMSDKTFEGYIIAFIHMRSSFASSIRNIFEAHGLAEKNMH